MEFGQYVQSTWVTKEFPTVLFLARYPDQIASLAHPRDLPRGEPIPRECPTFGMLLCPFPANKKSAGYRPGFRARPG